MLGLCGPWLDALELCDTDGVPADRVDRAILVASELMFAASGRQFTGLCVDTVRPCPPGCGPQWLAYPDALAVAARPIGGGQLGCGCPGDVIGCGCAGHPAIALPHTPVVEVDEILVDGVPLPDGSTVIVDDKWLLRRDGLPWPCCQDMTRLATEPGTWSIEYTFGTAPPAAGILAAEVLACEFIRGWTGDPGCRLPRQMTNLIREGVNATFLDTSVQMLREGWYGITEISAFVEQTNPAGLQRSARVIDPYRRGGRPRRVRP